MKIQVVNSMVSYCNTLSRRKLSSQTSKSKYLKLKIKSQSKIRFPNQKVKRQNQPNNKIVKLCIKKLAICLLQPASTQIENIMLRTCVHHVTGKTEKHNQQLHVSTLIETIIQLACANPVTSFITKRKEQRKNNKN